MLLSILLTGIWTQLPSSGSSVKSGRQQRPHGARPHPGDHASCGSAVPGWAERIARSRGRRGSRGDDPGRQQHAEGKAGGGGEMGDHESGDGGGGGSFLSPPRCRSRRNCWRWRGGWGRVRQRPAPTRVVNLIRALLVQETRDGFVPRATDGQWRRIGFLIHGEPPPPHGDDPIRAIWIPHGMRWGMVAAFVLLLAVEAARRTDGRGRRWWLPTLGGLALVAGPTRELYTHWKIFSDWSVKRIL